MKRRIFDDQPFVHCITFNCYRRRELLSLDHPKRILLGVLKQELQRLRSYFQFYSHARPHQSLDYRTPWEVHHSLPSLSRRST